MTSELITRFVEQRPFVPFTMILAHGREIHGPHSDFASLGRAVQSVPVIVPTGQLQSVDVSLVVSIRTFHIVDFPTS